MLILKCSSSTSEELNDVYVLNLSFCSNVQVINEPNNPVVDAPQKLNLEQLKIKLRNNVDQRQRWVKSNNADVSTEGQELYRAIAKHFKVR
uniref:AD domain-containing protein n=1 Tax=Megaselia scalaris TaxID=36166 RepID=T1GPB5_MEGSC